MPGGAEVKYTSSGLSVYRMPDWLGSLRAGSNPNRTYNGSLAFAPFGERYSASGTPAYAFTGARPDIVTDEYDFLFRKYHSTQGRWISPDPAGLAAAEPTNPQSWNRYAYAGGNPLNAVDPMGLAAGGCQGDPGIRCSNMQGGCVAGGNVGGLTNPCVGGGGDCGLSIDGGGTAPCSLIFGGQGVTWAQVASIPMVGWKYGTVETPIPLSDPLPDDANSAAIIYTGWYQGTIDTVPNNEIPIIDEPGTPGANVDVQVANKNANSLGKALNATGAQTLQNPCLYASWAVLASAGSAIGVGYINTGGVTGVVNRAPTLINRAGAWLYNFGTTPAKPGLVNAAVMTAVSGWHAAGTACKQF